MITIKQNDNGFAVTHYGTKLSAVELRTFDLAKDLCRLRLGTTQKENNITIIKVPFIGLWLVW